MGEKLSGVMERQGISESKSPRWLTMIPEYPSGCATRARSQMEVLRGRVDPVDRDEPVLAFGAVPLLFDTEMDPHAR